MATIALDQSTAGQLAVARVAAFGTAEPLRPAPLKDGLSALLLSTELLKEFRETHAFLKLHLILGHWKLLDSFRNFRLALGLLNS